MFLYHFKYFLLDSSTILTGKTNFRKALWVKPTKSCAWRVDMLNGDDISFKFNPLLEVKYVRKPRMLYCTWRVDMLLFVRCMFPTPLLSQSPTYEVAPFLGFIRLPIIYICYSSNLNLDWIHKTPLTLVYWAYKTRKIPWCYCKFSYIS